MLRKSRPFLGLVVASALTLSLAACVPNAPAAPSTDPTNSTSTSEPNTPTTSTPSTDTPSTGSAAQQDIANRVTKFYELLMSAKDLDKLEGIFKQTEQPKPAEYPIFTEQIKGVFSNELTDMIHDRELNAEEKFTLWVVFAVAASLFSAMSSDFKISVDPSQIIINGSEAVVPGKAVKISAGSLGSDESEESVTMIFVDGAWKFNGKTLASDLNMGN